MLRGKESSNRIELSRLVQELLKFGVLGSMWLWGGGRWVGGVWGHLGHGGGVPTCTHMHAHVYMCVCMCACVHVHVNVCMHRTPPPHPYPPLPPSTHLPPPRGDPCN